MLQNKDYKSWTEQKIKVNNISKLKFFQEREVWWCVLGENIGYEQDGKKSLFLRPVIIIRKFNLYSCLIVPLTKRGKDGTYYFPLGKVGKIESTAIISQLRYIDQKRLIMKLCTIENALFQGLISKIFTNCLQTPIK